MTGEAQQVSTEDFEKAFDAKLLMFLTNSSQPSGTDSDGEGSSGPAGKSDELNLHETDDGVLYFKGYPECDYLRQVSYIRFNTDFAHPNFIFSRTPILLLTLMFCAHFSIRLTLCCTSGTSLATSLLPSFRCRVSPMKLTL